MNALFGSPWPIMIGGLVVETVLIVGLVRSGRGALLGAIAGVGLLTAALLAVERMVVTESERVEAALEGLSAALVSNDQQAVLSFISPDAAQVRGLAQSRLSEVRINEAHVGADLSIKLDETARPPSAITDFTGRFRFALTRGGSFGHDGMVQHFHLRWIKEDDKWLLDAVEWNDPARR